MDKNNDYFKPEQLFQLNYLISRIKSIRSFEDLIERFYNASILLYKIGTFRYGKRYWKTLAGTMELSKKAGLFIEEGKDSFKAGKYSEAEKEFKKAIMLYVESKEAHYELGKVYYIQNKFKEAEEELKKALKISKKKRDVEKEYSAGNVSACLMLGKVYKVTNQHEKALKKYGQAVKLCKGDKIIEEETYTDTAQIYFEQNKYEQAIADAKKALEINPRNILACLLLARVYEKTNRYEDALGELKNAEKIVEDRPEMQMSYDDKEYIYFSLAKIYKKLKKFDLSSEASSKYLEVEALNDKKNNAELINTFKEAGNNKEAKALRVKILRTPYFEDRSKDEIDYSLLMPLGMSQIVSYLRSNGIELDQDDLYIKINYENMFGEEKDSIDTEIFYDENRVIEYSAGKDDAYMDSIMEKAEVKSKMSGYDVVLLSIPEGLVNISGYLFALSYIRYIKKKYNPVIIIGGPQSAVDSMRKYDTKNIDYIVLGRGEKVLFRMLSALKYKVDFNKIHDIEITGNGKLIEYKEGILGVEPDFDDLPINLYEFKKPDTASDLDKEIDNELSDFYNSKIMVMPFMLMQGCFYECIFCNDANSTVVLSRDPKKAVKNLRSLKERYGVKCFLFLNNAINLSKKYVNDFCDELINAKLDILWSDCARADNLDREMLAKMRRSGCIRLIYGMETASPRLLKYIDKKINLERLEDVLSWTSGSGIWTGLETITGFPQETDADLKMSIDFIHRNKANIDTVYYNALMLPKQSKLYLNPEKYGIKNLHGVDFKKDSRDMLRTISSGYDEIGGLKWEDKLKQMVEGFKYVQKETDGIENPFFKYEMEHFLFYLYSKYDNKKEIIRIINKVINIRH